MNTSILIIFTPGVALAWILFWICRYFSRVRILNNPLTSGPRSQWGILGITDFSFLELPSAEGNQTRQWKNPSFIDDFPIQNLQS